MLKRWRNERWFHAHETARMDELNGLPLASFRQRAFAYTIDLIIIALVSLLFSRFRFHTHERETCKTLTEAMMELGEHARQLAESVLYFAVAARLMNGQTPGKWLMKIRIVSLTEDHLGWWQCVERALGYGASLLEGGFGFFQYWMNKNRMCVHDRIAETIVVDLRKARKEPAIKTDAAELAYEAGDR
ncbi:MAG: RDD family protein [Acidobacteriaceae bacterium]|nr:RDD family protein [Acidobacteriaceae bacterium]